MRVDELRFAAAYVEPVSTLIGALKDDGRRDLARELARLVVRRCAPPPPNACLIPVPSTRGRQAMRGFNQAALLATHLAREWGCTSAPVLRRIREDPPQRGASATDRAANVRGAFAVRPGTAVSPDVWIVDDVCTTGATLSACALAVRRAGARHVGAFCVARVLRNSFG